MIDLKSAFGHRYRVTLDESAHAPGQTKADRLWCRRIACKYGHVYVHDVATLGAFTDRLRVAARLRAIPGVRVHQRGDRECSVTFPPGLLPEVARVLGARRRRVLTEDQRARLAAAGAPTRRLARRTEGGSAGQERSAAVGWGNPPSAPYNRS